MDSAQQILQNVKVEVDALDASLAEYGQAIEGVYEQHRLQVRALMSTRRHQILEEQVCNAQMRLDSAIPEDADAREWGSVRAERKRLLEALDKIDKAVHQKTSE